jgi:hypothetical protein
MLFDRLEKKRGALQRYVLMQTAPPADASKERASWQGEEDRAFGSCPRDGSRNPTLPNGHDSAIHNELMKIVLPFKLRHPFDV